MYFNDIFATQIQLLQDRITCTYCTFLVGRSPRKWWGLLAINFFSSSLSHLQERNKQSRVVVSQLHFRKNGQCTTYSNSRVLPSPFLLHLPLLPYLYASSSWSCNKCTSYKSVGTSKNKQTRNKNFSLFLTVSSHLQLGRYQANQTSLPHCLMVFHWSIARGLD